MLLLSEQLGSGGFLVDWTRWTHPVVVLPFETVRHHLPFVHPGAILDPAATSVRITGRREVATNRSQSVHTQNVGVCFV